MKSTIAKAALTGGVALAALGIGAGVASADPAHNYTPDRQNNWQQDQDHRNDWQQNQRRDNDDHYQQPQHHDWDHGFWFFGRWIPLPW